MFGTNKILKQEESDGQVLWVQEIFPTLQGEGPRAGQPAIFIRLAGCNLRCFFCDTDFESSVWRPDLEELMERVDKVAEQVNAQLVVLTGGEPMRQNIIPLMSLLMDAGYTPQIETAGTLWLEELSPIYVRDGLIEFVCSPKTPKVDENIEIHCNHWKYIIRAGETDPNDGLPNKSTQSLGVTQQIYRPRYPGTIWLQPCEEYMEVVHRPGQGGLRKFVDQERTHANTLLVAKLAMKYGYRVSVQLHKILGLP